MKIMINTDFIVNDLLNGAQFEMAAKWLSNERAGSLGWRFYGGFSCAQLNKNILDLNGKFIVIYIKRIKMAIVNTDRGAVSISMVVWKRMLLY